MRASSRPSSRAKKALPADISWMRASCCGVTSRPSRSSSRRRRASRLNALSHRRSSRSSGKALSRANGTAVPGSLRSVASSPTRAPPRRRSAICSTAADGESSHWTSSSASTSGPVAASAFRTSSSARPIARIGRAVAGLGQQQSDLERPAAQRRKRGGHLVEHGRHEVGEPGERQRSLRPRRCGARAPARSAAPLRARRAPTGSSSPDPGGACQDEGRRAVPDVGEERLQRPQLLVAADDPWRRHPLIRGS